MCPNYQESQKSGESSEPTLSKAELKREKVLLYTAFALLSLTRGVPRHVKKVLDTNDLPILVNSLTAIAIAEATRFEQKFRTIGTSPKNYVGIFTNAYAGLMRPVKRAIKESEKKLGLKKKKNIQTSRELITPTERQLEIISEYTKDISPAKEVGKNQKILIIAGPIGSGKTEILKQEDTKDMVLIDLDIIRSKLDPSYDQTNQRDIRRLQEESWFVSDLILMKALKEGKSVVIQTPLHRRKRWMNDERLLYAKRHEIPIEIKMILRPFTDCIERNLRRSRSASLRDSYKSMNGMSVLIELVQKFGNISNVELHDFYPLKRESQLLNSVAFYDQYLKLMSYAAKRNLMSYAAKRPEIFKIFKKEEELKVHN